MPVPAETGKMENGTSWMQKKRRTQILLLVGYSGIIPWTSHWRCSTVKEWTTLPLMRKNWLQRDEFRIEQHVKVWSHVVCVLLIYSLMGIFLFTVLLYDCWWWCSFLLHLLASIYSVIHLYVEPFASFPQPLIVACLYLSQGGFTKDMAYVCFTYTWSDDSHSCNGQHHLQSDVPCHFKMTAAHFSPAQFLRHERVNAARDIPQSAGSRKLQVSLTVSWPSAADLQEVF